MIDATAVFERVWRDGPGHHLQDLGADGDPRTLRRLQADLALELIRLCAEATGAAWSLVSAGRFDQQRTARPHRDGGPDRSVLLLGYEPSPVASTLALVTFADAGEYGRLTAPDGPDGDLLARRRRPVADFDPSRWQLLVVNNSVAARDGGVLHEATVPRPDAARRRVVNSLMIGQTATPAAVGLEEFVVSDAVL